MMSSVRWLATELADDLSPPLETGAVWGRPLETGAVWGRFRRGGGTIALDLCVDSLNARG